jgi:hypothetical protein
MNSINLPSEYIMQMYVNALAKKGVDKVLLLETLNEINDATIKFLAMANDEINNVNKGGKPKISKAKKEKKEEKKETKEDKTNKTETNKEEKKEKKETKKTEKKTVQLLSDNEESNANQLVAKIPCKHVLTAGKNKGKECGKVGCKSHTKIIPTEKKPSPVPVPEKQFASLHEITLTDEEWATFDLSSTIQQYVTKDWVRGDVVGVTNTEGYGYRNTGKYMWDGKKLVQLNDEYDEYGHVPSKFMVGKEFDNAMYWSKVIDHNEFVYATFAKQNIKNLVQIEGGIKFDYTINGVTSTWCTIGEPIDDCWNYYSGQVTIPEGVNKEHVLVGINYGYE